MTFKNSHNLFIYLKGVYHLSKSTLHKQKFVLNTLIYFEVISIKKKLNLTYLAKSILIIYSLPVNIGKKKYIYYDIKLYVSKQYSLASYF